MAKTSANEKKVEAKIIKLSTAAPGGKRKKKQQVEDELEMLFDIFGVR